MKPFILALILSAVVFNEAIVPLLDKADACEWVETSGENQGEKEGKEGQKEESKLHSSSLSMLFAQPAYPQTKSNPAYRLPNHQAVYLNQFSPPPEV